MRIVTSICFISIFFIVHSQTPDPNAIAGETHPVYSEALGSKVSVIVYEPTSVEPDARVTPVLYVFGDFLFETFAGSISYLHSGLSLIPDCILVGINEVPEKQIGPYQQEYTQFIAVELMDWLSAKYDLNTDGVLFGHSRATRLVARVILEDPEYLDQFILSAPWYTEQHLQELENSLSGRSERISVYYAHAGEDMANPEIQEANEKFTQLMDSYKQVVRSKYQYFEEETHMSIPPLSFYFGIKFLLQ